MTPEQLAKSGTEHAEQRALFCWVAMAANHGFETADDMLSYTSLNTGHRKYSVPELKWLHAIPNAGARGNKVAASQLKAEGVKAGVADIFLPVKAAVAGYDGTPVYAIRHSGLYIEMKRKNGNLSDVTAEQREFMLFVESQGFVWTVAFGWRHAANEIKRYLTFRNADREYSQQYFDNLKQLWPGKKQ